MPIGAPSGMRPVFLHFRESPGARSQPPPPPGGTPSDRAWTGEGRVTWTPCWAGNSGTPRAAVPRMCPGEGLRLGVFRRPELEATPLTDSETPPPIGTLAPVCPAAGGKKNNL